MSPQPAPGPAIPQGDKTAHGQATLRQWKREWLDFMSRVERIIR